MPLIKSGSREAISTNISEMVAAGHPRKQAIAAALSTARRYGKAEGGYIPEADKKPLDKYKIKQVKPKQGDDQMELDPESDYPIPSSPNQGWVGDEVLNGPMFSYGVRGPYADGGGVGDDSTPDIDPNSPVPRITVRPRANTLTGPPEVAKPGQTVPQQPSFEDINRGAASVGRDVAKSFVPQSMQDTSPEDIADWNRRMSAAMQHPQAGKMNLPNIDPSWSDQMVKGALEGVGMFGIPGEGVAVKGAAALAPKLGGLLGFGAKAALKSGAEGVVEKAAAPVVEDEIKNLVSSTFGQSAPKGDFVAQLAKDKSAFQQEPWSIGVTPDMFRSDLSTKSYQLMDGYDAGHDSMVKMFKGIGNGLTDAQRDAISMWTDPSGYKSINSNLRNVKSDAVSSAAIKNIDNLMQNSKITRPVIAWRGIHGPHADAFGQLKEGDSFYNEGYAATTLDPRKATHYGSQGYMLAYHLPEGTSALYVSHPELNSWSPERELLLPHHQQFVIKNVEHVESPIWGYTGEIENPSPQKMTIVHVEPDPNQGFGDSLPIDEPHNISNKPYVTAPPPQDEQGKVENISPEQILNMIKPQSVQNQAAMLIAFAKAGNGAAALQAKLALPSLVKKSVNKMLWALKKHGPQEDADIISTLYADKTIPVPKTSSDKKPTAEAIKDYDKEMEEYYKAIDDQEQHQYEIAQGIAGTEGGWISLTYDQGQERIKNLLKPVDWASYTPPNTKTYTTPKLTSANPADISKLGFNLKLQLYKGGQQDFIGHFPEVHLKDYEPAFFLADNKDVAEGYGYASPYVARAPKAAEINWTELINGPLTPEKIEDLKEYYGIVNFKNWAEGYTGSIMDPLIRYARKQKLDLLIVHRISDVAGSGYVPQTQYLFLNTAGTLRSIHAKFDPAKLHLAHSHWGLLGGGVLTYGALQGQDEEQPMIKRASGGPAPFKLRGYQESIGAPMASSEPGVRHFSTPHAGMIHSPVPGRTDKLSMNVKGGSYVLPADIVSGVGQGNSMAGSSILNKFFKMDPYGAAAGKIGTPKVNYGKMMTPTRPMVQSSIFRTPKFASGGHEDNPHESVPIVAAGGEFVVPPHVVQRLGGGNMKKGHEILDHFVLHLRAKNIKEQRGLKPPVK